MVDDVLPSDAPCGFMGFDDDGVLRVVNANLARWLGCEIGALVGRNVATLYVPGGAIFHQTHFFPLLKLHGKAEEIYLSLRGGDGKTLPVLANAHRHEVDGQWRNDCVLVPMRQRHRFEHELVRARGEAEAARDSKARFLSMMAHEVRTPLSAVTGLAHVLQNELHGPLTEDQHEDVRMILKAGTDIDRLIGETLRYSRAQAGQDVATVQPVPLVGALEAVEAIMRTRWDEQHLRYDRLRVPTGCVVLADPMRLHQILLNLLANAANFTPPGGMVSIDCTSDTDGRHARISVRDSGCGIAGDQLERIFEPFVQIDRADRPAGKRGTGLGLAISREFAMAMGGTLEAASTPGAGSEFRLTLPIAA